MSKKRLDQILVDRSLAPSRSQAQARIMMGHVKVNDVVQKKAGFQVSDADEVELLDTPRFVGRGGDKLSAAIDAFDIDVRDSVVVDAGVSTGGFADCLLQLGAKQVFGIDVGYGDVAWSIRNHERFQILERTNFRHLFSPEVDRGGLQEWIGKIDLVVMDLSFISLTKVVDSVSRLLRKNGRVLALVKPQFEVGREAVGKGGIVRDEAARQAAIAQVCEHYAAQGFEILGQANAAIKGAKGNQEAFMYASWSMPTAHCER